MAFVFIGVTGYAVLLVYDMAMVHKRRIIETFSGIIGSGLVVFSFIMVLRTSPRWSLPLYVSIPAGITSAILFLLLIYSLTLEIPFKRTYLHKSAPSKLITTGTYALTRHPGVLWLFLFLLSAFAASGAWFVLLCAVLWTGADIAYVVIQERFIFPAIFGVEYESYISTTPMLVPTKTSLMRCIRTLGARD